MLTVPEFEHPQQGRYGLTSQQYLIAFINKISECAPHVVESLRREVFEPYGDVLRGAITRSADQDTYATLENLERYAFSLARPVFRKHHPDYDPLPEVLMSGIGFRDMNQRDIIAEEFLDDSVTEDVAGHPSRYPAQCRHLGAMSLRQGKGSCSTWMRITSADESCHPELVPARAAIAKWASDHQLRKHARDSELGADEWLFEESICEIAMSTVCAWPSYGTADSEFYYSVGPAAPMPMCSCTRPRGPGWYTHSVLGCPTIIERHGPRPQQTLIAQLPDWPRYEPFPRHAERHQAHNRRYHSEQVKVWLASHLSRETVALTQSAFAGMPGSIRNDLVKYYENTDKLDCDRIDEWCLATGLQRAPKPDAPLDQHVTWAVRFQVLRESYYDIARSLEFKSTRPRKIKQPRSGKVGDLPVSKNTVYRNVRRVLAAIGLRPRATLL